jgi:hypothetical protein
MIQELVVYLIVAGAAAYLVRMAWSAARGQAGCGGCEGACGGKTKTGNKATTPQLVQIQMNGRPLTVPKPSPDTTPENS